MFEIRKMLNTRDKNQEKEPAGANIKKIESSQFLKCIRERDSHGMLDMSRLFVKNADFTNANLRNIDFSCTRFEDCCFDGADFDGSDVSRCFFVNCSMRKVALTNANASDASFRENDMSGSNFSGTNFYYAALEFANLKDVRTDGKTRWFGDAVPKDGAFICWKVGAENRVIQLLVPAEGRRVCATNEAGRCDLAKVLSITDPARQIEYDWAQSITHDDFIYEVGKYIRPDNGFGTNGWMDDSPGIHFFMDREMAIAYGTGKMWS